MQRLLILNASKPSDFLFRNGHCLVFPMLNVHFYKDTKLITSTKQQLPNPQIKTTVTFCCS